MNHNYMFTNFRFQEEMVGDIFIYPSVNILDFKSDLTEETVFEYEIGNYFENLIYTRNISELLRINQKGTNSVGLCSNGYCTVNSWALTNSTNIDLTRVTNPSDTHPFHPSIYLSGWIRG